MTSTIVVFTIAGLLIIWVGILGFRDWKSLEKEIKELEDRYTKYPSKHWMNSLRGL